MYKIRQEQAPSGSGAGHTTVLHSTQALIAAVASKPWQTDNDIRFKSRVRHLSYKNSTQLRLCSGVCNCNLQKSKSKAGMDEITNGHILPCLDCFRLEDAMSK